MGAVKEHQYVIILSRSHAEELYPNASDSTLERIERITRQSGAVIAVLQASGFGEIHLAINGVQVANKVGRR